METNTAKKHVFTTMEKNTFIDILKSYSQIIENKCTDAVSLESKKLCWQKITAEYNAQPQIQLQATCKQLRRLWLNLKHRQRDALTKERQHRLATGGGPSVIDAQIDPDISIIAPALVVSVNGAIDSDTALENFGTEESMMNQVIPSTQGFVTTQAQVIPSTQVNTSSEVLRPTHDVPSSQVLPLTHDVPSTQFLPPTQIPSPTQLPAPTQTRNSQTSFKNSIIEREYYDRKARAEEIHTQELLLIKEKVREAKAKADLAELLLSNEATQ